MPFTIDFADDDVLAWTVTDDGATVRRIPDWTPTCYVQAHGADASLRAIDDLLAPDPRVRDLRVEEWRPGFRHGPEPMLAVDVDRVDAVTDVAHRVRERGPPGAYRCFDVDLSPQFRVCLDRDCSPEPAVEPTVLELAAPATQIVDPPLTAVRIERDPVSAEPGETDERPARAADAPWDAALGSGAGDAVELIDDGPAAVATAVHDALRAVDPDVLVFSTAGLVPALDATADAAGVDLRLGRDPAAYGAPRVEYPGWRQLARESTYESYGSVGHSPARYGVPGRAIVDRSNTFFYHQGGLPGCLDLVARSYKPLQELAWASIGNVLTAIQVREARRRDVLVPWHSWRHERFKRVDQLHAADRGGHTFSPDVGVHEAVHELDFQSLYPNVIRRYNVSPETVRCDCHPDRADVPELDYAVCPDEGYLPDVLGELIDDRAAAKAELGDCDDPDRRARLQGRSDAIKWILVSCFGYQGFSNAKFGRIECHEAINAYARRILLDAKERLEAGGWYLVHGIVDSLWVTAREGVEQEPLDDLCAEITAAANGIPLEYEGAFDWLSFVPLRDSTAGALTKYFGRRATADSPAAAAAPDDAAFPAERSSGEDAYKVRGIEYRQRSTPTFVADAQLAAIEAYDRERTPEAVCRALADHVARLEAGAVDPTDLVVRSSTSKASGEYEQYTRTVAALERAQAVGLDPSPGQDVTFVVVDDEADSRERVRLAREVRADGADYDVDFYRDLLVRAAESVASPLGWRREDLEDWLADRTDASLGAFT